MPEHDGGEAEGPPRCPPAPVFLMLLAFLLILAPLAWLIGLAKR